MRVALVQLAPQLGHVDANVERARRARRRGGRAAGQTLIVLPELALSGYAVSETDAGTRRFGSDDPRLRESVRARRQRRARRRVPRAGRTTGGRTRAWRGSSAGELVAAPPQAVPLRRALGRGTAVRAGRRARRVRHGRRPRGDARLQRRLASGRARGSRPATAPSSLVVSAASADPLPGERLDIAGTWDDLLRATARLLQVVVVFVNRSGEEAGLRYWGGSRVIDPWGDELARAGREEGLTVVDVDPGSVAAARAEYDVAGDSPWLWPRPAPQARRTAASD